MKKIILIVFVAFSFKTYCDDKPSWFLKDTKTDSGWDFYCTNSAEDEAKSLAMGQGQCSQKICMLFGVEVSAEVKTKETLTDASVTNTVIEKCPNVRVVGRIEKKKLVDCTEENCSAYVHHFYPKSEYLREYERLNRPTIVKEFEKTIIIREGNKVFRDPKLCKEKLNFYLDVRGENEKSFELRKGSLTLAASECKSLDDRDVTLQSNLRGLISKSIIHRSYAFSLMASRFLISGGELVGLINKMIELEISFAESGKYDAVVSRLVLDNYDWIFPRMSYVGNVGWVLLSGQAVVDNPIETENKTCIKHSQVLQKWPDKFLGEVQVCAPNVTGGEICQSVSEQIMRYKYLNCLCTKETQNVQDCVKNLNQFVTDNCKDRMGIDCLKRLAQYASDSLSLGNIADKKRSN